MGESSTCLVRSFSTTVDTSCKSQECDPIRALGESISFGRFITEGLDWERWSTFSHKRYVEEAEKYSKPGSVAAKKAYFEAHYRKKSQERAAALIQEANAQANRTLDSEAWEGNCSCADSSIGMNSKVDNNIVTANEQPNKDSVSYQVVECGDTNQYKYDSRPILDSEAWEGNCSCNDSSIEMNSEADHNVVIANEQPDKETVCYQVVECADTNQYKYDTRHILNSEVWEGNRGCNVSSIEMNSKAYDNIVTTNEQPYKETVCYQVVECADTNQHKYDARNILDSEAWEGNCSCDDSSIEMNSKADDNIVTANEQPGKEIQIVECANTNQYKYDAIQSDLDTSNVEGAEDVPHPCIDTTNLNVESCTLLDNSNQFHHVEVHKNIAVHVEERALDHGAGGQEVLALPVKGRKVITSPKLSTRTRAAKLPHSLDERKAAAAVPARSGIQDGLRSKKFVGNSVEKKRPTARSLHMSINLPSCTGETSKKIAAASQSRNGSFSTSKKSVGGTAKKRITAPSHYMSVNLPSGTSVTSPTATAAVKPRNGINFAAKSMKSVQDSVEKRPTASKAVPDETSKTTSVIEQNRIKKIRSNLPKDNPVALRTSTKASHGLLNQPSANPPSQGRRIERLLNKSVSGGVTSNAKLSSSISLESYKLLNRSVSGGVTSNSKLSSSISFESYKPLNKSVSGGVTSNAKLSSSVSLDSSSSSTTKSNPQSATVSSPFRFRSEERAMKRKEYLQRMNETRSKEEVKVQLQRIPKGKTENNPKDSISILNEDRPGGSQSASNHTRKSSPTLPRSPPKFGRKASCSTVQNRKLGNSWKPPICTKNSKRTTEKVNRTTRQSVASLSNTTRENASPNIQH
ncbi:hypothetical protein VNO77_44137 [Canavalia gladiata]|uniref:TPX2 C-terminal domain-containing protein n=1 Tax=Canavalia gladiata TaxID=3824 RepID=A0AAN9JY01_CANGL